MTLNKLMKKPMKVAWINLNMNLFLKKSIILFKKIFLLKTLTVKPNLLLKVKNKLNKLNNKLLTLNIPLNKKNKLIIILKPKSEIFKPKKTLKIKIYNKNLIIKVLMNKFFKKNPPINKIIIKNCKIHPKITQFIFNLVKHLI
jgi:hypothetical protein